MKTKGIIQSVCLLLIILGFNIDADSAEHNQADKPAIYVSIPPLAFLVEQICGADCNVITIIGPGQSPATFETTPKQMIDISKSVIYFTAGVPFEKQLNKKLKSSLENEISLGKMFETVQYG